MTTTPSETSSVPVAHVLEVPYTADSVAPARLLHGSLNPIPSAPDDAYDAIYFELDDQDGLRGRVTFEGLDAVRTSRGENLPFELAGPRDAADWVFTVNPSPWLAERHQYEMRNYSTSLLESHQHYIFQFHDDFIESIAEGIWMDQVDPESPLAPPVNHPLAPFEPDSPCERFVSRSGIEWELRRSPRAADELIRGARLCSQRLYQFNLMLDGDSREGASVWLRTINGKLISRMTQAWTGERAATQLIQATR